MTATRGWRLLRSFASLEPASWANGAGSTTELVSFDQSVHITGPDIAPWRLSVARLEQPAAFSELPGVQRTFLPIGGDVQLVVDGKIREVREHRPTSFRGASAVALRRLDRPCYAINLMVADSATIRRVALTGLGPSGAHVVAAIPVESSADFHRFDLWAPGDDRDVDMVHLLLVRAATGFEDRERRLGAG